MTPQFYSQGQPIPRLLNTLLKLLKSMDFQGLSQILIIFNLKPNCTLGVKMGKERMNGKPLLNYNNSLATYTNLKDKIR